MTQKTLHSGERMRLTATDAFVRIVEGDVEIYASIPSSAPKEFLTELKPNDAVFPFCRNDKDFSSDDLDVYEEIYSEEGAKIEILPFDAYPATKLREFMGKWLRRLAEIPWLGRLISHGDDTLLSWRRQTALPKTENLTELIEKFSMQTEIFLTLLELRPSMRKNLGKHRLNLLERDGERADEISARLLLGEEVVDYAASGEVSDETLKEAEFIIKLATQELKIPFGSTSMGAEMTDKLDPVRLLNMLAQKNNMMLRFATLPKNWHKKDYGVMIGYMGREKTLCVITRNIFGDYIIKTADNPKGSHFNSQNKDTRISEVFLCYPGLPEKKMDRIALRNFLWKYVTPKDHRIILITSLLMGIIAIISPLITEVVFTDAILLVNSFSLIVSAQIFFAVGITVAALATVRSIAATRLTTSLDMTLQAALIARILRLPPQKLRRFSSYDLANRITSLSDNGQTLTRLLTTAPDAVFSIFVFFVMAHYSPLISFLVAFVTLAAGVILYLYHSRLQSERRQFLTAHGRTIGITRQILAAIGKFRVQGALTRAFRLWSERFGKREKIADELRKYEEIPHLMLSARPFILTAIICLPFSGQFSRSQFLAFLVAVVSFTSSIERFYEAIGNFFDLQAKFEALAPFLEDAPESIRSKSEAGQPDGSVEVSRLTFAYEGGENVLQDVNFRLAPGEYAALVGKSGSGKSTLLRLLLGLEKPQNGTIYYNGQDISELNMTSLRSHIGVVWQDGELSAGDIFSNIAGTETITEEEAWEAAEAAGISDDIAAMPMGMNTIITENGANLSGGQRQRIQIASALARKPAILLFDEATASLDNKTQAIVGDTLAKLKATRLIIAHRLSTIKGADRILVLDNGRIVENGSFDELMKHKGVFRELMTGQVE